MPYIDLWLIKTIFNATLNVYRISSLIGRRSKLLFLLVVTWLIIIVEHSKFICVCIEYSRFIEYNKCMC